MNSAVSPRLLAPERRECLLVKCGAQNSPAQLLETLACLSADGDGFHGQPQRLRQQPLQLARPLLCRFRAALGGRQCRELPLLCGAVPPKLCVYSLRHGLAKGADDRFIAYVSDEAGRYQIYVRPFPGPGGKWQISVDGGMEPYWSSDGKQIFFRNREQLLAVDVDTTSGFSAGRPRVVLEEMKTLLPEHNYSVAADGQRFLVIESAEEGDTGPDRINVVVNWFEALPPG